MEGGKIIDGCNNNLANVLLHHDQRLPCSSSTEVLDSLWIANSSPSFHGSASMVKFDERTRERPFFPQSDKEENGNDDYDGCFHPPEKKRRLLPEQVQFLEKNFEIENKLEPERKVQLAKQIGLQPRQVAIWFQNRRARYKTKHIEKEFDCLKANYDKLKEDYDTLFKENEKLKNEVHELTEKLLLREKEKTISPVDAEPQNQCPNAVSENVSSVPIVVCKNLEDASSAKSDVFDSDSPHFSLDDSSNMFEPDPSDHFSQDEDESLTKKLFHAPSFTQLEAECYSDLQENPSILGHPIEEHGTWFWNF